MRFLNWNHRKVQDLSPGEIWMFITGRVLMSFGGGILSMIYFPDVAKWLALPSIVIGFILLIFAAKGLFRKTNSK
jgi:hypothetical protein